MCIKSKLSAAVLENPQYVLGAQQPVCLVTVFSLTSHNKTHFGQEHSDSVSASSAVNTEDSNAFKDTLKNALQADVSQNCNICEV